MNDEGLKLLKAFVEFVADDDPDFPWCRYCGQETEGSHEPHCLWSRARAYLRDHGVEVKADE